MGMTNVNSIVHPLRFPEKHSKLQLSPDGLDPISIIVLLLLFIGRALKYAIGLGIPFIPLKQAPSNRTTEHHEQQYMLPDLSLTMPLQITSAHLKTFTKAIVSQSKVEVNNGQLCLFLASLSEPAMLLLLAKRGCPVRPLGAVNVRNRFELLRPDLCRRLISSAESQDSEPTSPSKPSNPPTLSTTAKFARPARKVQRGIEIDIEVTINLTEPCTNPNTTSTTEFMNEPSKSSSATTTRIFTQQFTMLQFQKHTHAPPPPQQPPPSSPPKPAILCTPLPRSLPHHWARLCKDYNPIHFSGILARSLGQPGQIAHGNHVVGVCIQAMTRFAHGVPLFAVELELGVNGEIEAVRRLVGERSEGGLERGFRMDVGFRRPVVVPASFGPRMRRGGDGFEIVDDRTGKVCVEVWFGDID